MPDSSPLLPKANSFLNDLPVYSVSETEEDIIERYGLDRVVYLASNENPFGCSDQVAAAIVNVSLNASRYPDASASKLRQKLAELNSVSIDNVLVGNGSNEILDNVARAYLNDGDEVVISDHSFAMYPIFAKSVGAIVNSVPMNDWCVDLDAIKSEISNSTKVVYIANANNPTGSMLSVADIQKFLTEIPSSIVVVIDEAYIEFSDESYHSVVQLIEHFENLVVSRTFSKAYGLAGLRIGYGIACKVVLRNLQKMCRPFNVNLVALDAAEAALDDVEFLNKTVEENRKQKGILQRWFLENEIEYLPSQANFLTFQVKGRAEACIQFLKQRGVIVRGLSGYGMVNWVRVSVGLSDENIRFTQVLSEFLEFKSE
jgi:histidinol-phosphate aminotransferase